MQPSPHASAAALRRPDSSWAVPVERLLARWLSPTLGRLQLRQRTSDGTSAAVARAYDAAIQDHGDLGLGRGSFESELLERIRQRLARRELVPDPARVLAAIEQSYTTDVYLTIACSLELDAGWRRLEYTFLRNLERALIKRRVPAGRAREVREEMLGDLVSPTSSGEPLISTYDGSGKLSTWLLVIALRRAADRARQRTARPLDEPGLEAGEPPPDRNVSADPLDEAIKGEHADRLYIALQDALRELSPRERLILTLKYADGMTQRAIAESIGISETRVSRSLGPALERVQRNLRKAVGDIDPEHWPDPTHALRILARDHGDGESEGVQR